MDTITERLGPSETLFQRFEAKYWVSEMEVAAIRAYIAPYVKLDKHAGASGRYAINSLYLDNEALDLHRSSVYGERNRFKLRLRAYTNAPEDPVFFEVKRRIDKIIYKERAVVRRDCVASLLRGTRYDADVLVEPSSAGLARLLRFRDYMDCLGAMPQCMVHYVREAFVSVLGEPVRISFDHTLSGLPVPYYTPQVWTKGPAWHPVDMFDCIMEIKFSGVLPRWAGNMIRHFELTRVSVAKYVHVVDTFKSRGIRLDARVQGVPA